MSQSTNNKLIKVAIADDHLLYKEGIKMALSFYKDISIVIDANNGMNLLELLKTSRPDVILLDVQMPVMNGVTVLHHIKTTYPDVAVIILSMSISAELVDRLMELGASSYLTKSSDPEAIYSKIKAAVNKN